MITIKISRQGGKTVEVVFDYDDQRYRFETQKRRGITLAVPRELSQPLLLLVSWEEFQPGQWDVRVERTEIGDIVWADKLKFG